MLKIAIPTRENVVDDHFGHCEMYTIFTIGAGNKIEKRETHPSPAGCGCKSNIASDFQRMGVTVMLAGNMGNGALNVLNNHDINVVRGCCGDVLQVVETYLSGTINDSGESCHHHAEDHQCSH
jgi:predicted Fe-Mo cluster-binding NifX family protein